MFPFVSASIKGSIPLPMLYLPLSPGRWSGAEVFCVTAPRFDAVIPPVGANGHLPLPVSPQIQQRRISG